ncbi:sensor histidine kinase [Ramlibacter sp.]|uniref:sensor histidine kinase n=1 Tax=Ramlibacter sp. TaxID=1917967 RepID=UPI003D0C61FE
MTRRPLPRLASALLRRLIVPLAVAWLAGTALSFGTAWYFARSAFDRTLLEDAYLLATHVRAGGDRLELALSEDEVRRALFDRVETVHFAIRDDRGVLVAGNAALRVEAPDAGATYRFDDIDVRGEVLRAVHLRLASPQAVQVVVAETTLDRGDAFRRLIWSSLLPEATLLLVMALWVRRTIRRDMEPLSQLQQAVAARSGTDLAPVKADATSQELAALTGAINGLLARLASSVRAQREFAGNVAHELRTPLAGIRALAEYGLAQSDPAAWREQLERIAASQARASRLVDQLLDLALAEEAAAGLKFVPVALHELAADAVMRFLPRADAAGVDLGATGVDSPVHVMADATLVEAMLNNLVDNALRYGAAPDGEASTVTVSLERASGKVVLSVQDNGAHVPGEQQAALVARGAQGRLGELLGQGAGLGLSLVAQYARLMGADVSLGSGEGGRGWRCAVAFPAAVVPATAETPGSHAAFESPGSPPSRG